MLLVSKACSLLLLPTAMARLPGRDGFVGSGLGNPDRKATEEGGVVFLGMELGNCRMASMAQGKDAPAGLDHKDLS